MVKSFGTGFPAVAARHGCQLPGYDTRDSHPAAGHVTGHADSHDIGHAGASRVISGSHVVANGQAVTAPVANVATTVDTGPAITGHGPRVGHATGQDLDTANTVARPAGPDLATVQVLDAVPAACQDLDMATELDMATDLDMAGVVGRTAPTAVVAGRAGSPTPVLTSGVTPDVGGVTGLSPRRSDGSGYTLTACCPVCELPIDPAWSAANRTDRHLPCAAQPERMAAAVLAHRAAHPARSARPATPGRGSRPRPPTPTTATKRPATRPCPSGPAPAAGPRASHSRKDTTR